MNSKIWFGLLCFFTVSVVYGNPTVWPSWLSGANDITLLLPSERPLFSGSKINALQLTPVDSWKKSGPAVFGFIDKKGLFRARIETTFSSYGPSSVRIGKWVINNSLNVAAIGQEGALGVAEILDGVQETVLTNSRRMPFFDEISRRFYVGGDFIQLAAPIRIDGQNVTSIYFEPFFSVHPGSKVHFGHLDERGVFVDAPVQARRWRYLAASVLIELDHSKAEYLKLSRSQGGKKTVLFGHGMAEPVQVNSLTVVSDKMFFRKKDAIRSSVDCALELAVAKIGESESPKID